MTCMKTVSVVFSYVGAGRAKIPEILLAEGTHARDFSRGISGKSDILAVVSMIQVLLAVGDLGCLLDEKPIQNPRNGSDRRTC